jgi:hypothetical protein
VFTIAGYGASSMPASARVNGRRDLMLTLTR